MKKRTLVLMVFVAAIANDFAMANDRDHARSRFRSSIQVPAGVKGERELLKLARISLEDAVRIAREVVIGEVIESEIETERRNLVYAVELKNSRSILEVVIDAGNGAILDVEVEGQEDDDDDEDEDELEDD